MTTISKGRILIIDDSEIALESMRRLLEAAGYDVIARTSALGATTLIVRESIDVAIIDVNMPMMPGDRFAGLVRNNTRLSHVRLLMITGERNRDELLRLARDVGADAVLEKKDLTRDLLSVVRGLLTRGGATSPQNGPPKVLVVEDDDRAMEMTEARLRRMGCEVVTQTQAMGAMTAIIAHQPEIVLLDVRMPMLGGDVLAELLGENRATRDVGIIFHSILAEDDLGRLVREKGALGAIRKGSDDGDFERQFWELVEKFRGEH